MKLKSFGCSFIYGTDLSDIHDPRKPSHATWPALLAEQLDIEYCCHAGGGHGNLSILDRLSAAIYQDPADLFVIQWTFIDRFDFSDPDGHHFNKGTNDWSTLRSNDESDACDFYFRYLHSEYRDKLTSCLYINTALDMLQEKKCKFLMTSINDLILCDRYHVTDAMTTWQAKIRSNLTWFEGQDFLNWSLRQGFPVGVTGHPLEEAHAAAADLMWPAIDAILRRA